MTTDERRDRARDEILPGADLESLPVRLRDLLTARAERVVLPGPKVLARARETPRYAHFLMSGAGSLVAVLQDGRGIQTGLLGPGNLAEAYHLLGAAQVFTETMMEVSGTALRVPFGELQQMFNDSEDLRRFVFGQIHAHGLVAHQLVACSYYHELEARLAGSLLLVQEHARASSFHLTQEFLATMLGVRRTTLTLAAGHLQRLGLIRYSRGQIEICGPQQLAQMACECYEVIRTINSYCRFL